MVVLAGGAFFYERGTPVLLFLFRFFATCSAVIRSPGGKRLIKGVHVQGLGFCFQDLEFRVRGLRVGVQGLEFTVIIFLEMVWVRQ